MNRPPRGRQYQIFAQPVLDNDTQIIQSFESRWHFPWSEPVRIKIAPRLAIALVASGCFFTQVPPVPETVTVDKWHNPLSEPVRVKIGLKTNLQQTYTAPTFVEETITQDKWHYRWSEPVRFRIDPKHAIALRAPFTAWPEAALPPSIATNTLSPVIFSKTFQYQELAHTPLSVEIVTVDKWIYPLTDPVRQKIGLKTHLQQAAIGPVLDDETQILDTFESRWHYPWSEPVRIRRQVPVAEQQFLQAPVFTPEFITVDKWIYAWSEPVRQKIGIKTHLQTAAIGPVLDTETQIIDQYESRWHFAWSEPVRIRRQVPAGEQQTQVQGPVQTPEFITVDKWIYPWTDPVRQKIGLKTNLQQAFIAPVLDNETQIIQDFESRWHYPWSEPVRVKRPLLTAQQQSVAFQSAFFETINIDKWGFAWSEPVRQKIGLKTHLQQAFIGLTLEPETQITQDYESRWHFPWSEPVRIKRQIPVGEQQFLIQGPVQTPEFITVDKWIYAWTDPVRQKIGLATRLQQAFIAPVLNPETQITQDLESRWHYPWSEPVRFRRFPTAEQQAFTAPATSVFETIYPDKWTYAWSEPVRQKPGLRAGLQQAFIGLTLNPETQIIQGYESRWHQPWSEPVRRKLLLTGSQPTLSWSAFTPVSVVNEDSWHFPWSEPIRQKRGLPTGLQQSLAVPVIPNPVFVGSFSSPVVFLGPDTFQYLAYVIAPTQERITLDKWFAPLATPVRFKRFPTAEQPTYFAPTAPIAEIIRFDKWSYPWSEPVRQKIGLKVYLQQAFTAPVIPRPIFVASFGSPVIVDGPGILQYPAVFEAPLFQPVVLPGISVFLSATEVNADSAFFGVTSYNAVPVVTRVPTVVVSIKEIPAIRTSDVSLEEEPAINRGSVSIEET